MLVPEITAPVFILSESLTVIRETAPGNVAVLLVLICVFAYAFTVIAGANVVVSFAQ
jgi:hypothetical protein